MSLWSTYGLCLAVSLGFTWLFPEPSTLTQFGFFCLVAILTNVLYHLVLLVLPWRVLPNLERRAVFVTGCDSGFGHALALRLDSLGVPVYAGCLFPDGDGAKSLKTSASSRLKVVALDVTSQESIDKAVDVVKEHLGASRKLWAVVNNAGVAYMGAIEWCSAKMLRHTFDVNVFGVVEVTRAFLPLLRANREGRVIVTVSIAGRFTLPILTAYSMSKHAMVSFIDGLRTELRQWGISVHGIEPTLYGTIIADPKRVEQTMEQGWSSASEEVRKAYGDGCVSRTMGILKTIMSLFTRPLSKIGEVVDALADAAVGATPQKTYATGFVGQVHAWFFKIIPTSLLDSINQMLIPNSAAGAKKQKVL